MGFLAWIVLGLVAGFIASRVVNNSRGGLFTDLILGIIGALIGGVIVEKVPGLPAMVDGVSVFGLALGPLIIAVLGSILVLMIYHLLVRRGV